MRFSSSLLAILFLAAICEKSTGEQAVPDGRTTPATQPESTSLQEGPRIIDPRKELEETQDNVLLIVARLRSAPAWTEIPRTGGEQKRRALLDTCAFVSKFDLVEISAAVYMYYAEATPEAERLQLNIPPRVPTTGPHSQDLGAVSKLFVLNRFLFAVPETKISGEGQTFVGWAGVPKSGNAINLLWPLKEGANGLQIDGTFGGYYGAPYDAFFEFKAMNEKLGLRQKSKKDAQK